MKKVPIHYLSKLISHVNDKISFLMKKFIKSINNNKLIKLSITSNITFNNKI